MKNNRVRIFVLTQILVVLVIAKAVLVLRAEPAGGTSTTTEAVVSQASHQCVVCHTMKTPGIVDQWHDSSHARAGVSCAECHTAQAGEPDAQEHFGATISALVTPKDCGACHALETEQFLDSHHAKGGEVLGSLDNYLGEIVEGFGANVNGCQQCHGSIVQVDDKGKMTADTWPNFGIGRVNPDGTAGACSACHSRHDFSVAQARTPETCGRCHLGPDHPQKEVYEESKHNIAYRSHLDEMNMDRSQWVVGVDYCAAPVCASCHVSATPNQARTHDIGGRLSWNIRAPVSKKTKHSDQKRKAMQEVCMNCHNESYVDNFYTQFDAGVTLYNEKFAIPAGDMMKQLREANLLDATPFNEEIEWTYFFLWHHEGRRARNGLAMMGPDYVQWHGFYEIAERFYMELIPEAEHLLPNIADEILARPEHKWFRGNLSDGERKGINEYYQQRYRQKGM
jgi:hydroxylamine dehydrogenase